MAQIPLGNAGRATPGSVSLPSTGQAQAAAAFGQAVQNFGNAAAGVAINMQREADRQAAEERRKQAEMAEMAARAKDQEHLNATQDALTDAKDELSDGLKNGTVDKTQVETIWAERSKKIVDDAMPGFREQTRDLVHAQIGRLGGRYGNDLRKDVANRDRQDITAGIDQTLEYTQRQYKADPQGAERQAMATLDQLGPFSNYTPQQITAKKQAWKEGTQFTTAYEAISAGRDSRPALDRASKLIEGLPDLDPQKKAVLTDRIDAYKLAIEQRAALAAERYQREQERHLHQAEAAFTTFQAMADKGTALAPEYIDNVMQMTAGTPYQQGIKALAQQAQATGGLAAQPVRAQQATLDALDRQIAQNGRTPELTKRREQIAKVVDGTSADIQKDPMRAALERGVITEIKPLDMTGGVQGVLQQVQRRATAADRVATWAGHPVSPLTADEAEALSKQFLGMHAEDKANAIAIMASQVPRSQMMALAKQMEPKNRGLYLAMANGADMTTAGTPTSRLIFLGQDFLKAEGKGENSKVYREQQLRVSEVVGDMFAGQLRDDIVEAATLIQLGKKQDGQSMTAKTSVELALGGPLITHAGRPIPAAAGMTVDRFRDRLPAAGAAAVNGVPGGKIHSPNGEEMSAAEFLQALPQSELLPASQGRYYVRQGSGVAMDATGKKIVIEVR